jgi:hypothetical protein
MTGAFVAFLRPAFRFAGTMVHGHSHPWNGPRGASEKTTRQELPGR